MVWTPVPGMLIAIEFGPVILLASCSAARRLQVPALVAQTPLPMALSLASLVVLTTNCAPAGATSAGPARVVGAFGVAATNCRAETSTQPSPLGSFPVGSEHDPPTTRASAHAIATVAASVKVTLPSSVASRLSGAFPAGRVGSAVGSVSGRLDSSNSGGGAASVVVEPSTTTDTSAPFTSTSRRRPFLSTNRRSSKRISSAPALSGSTLSFKFCSWRRPSCLLLWSPGQSTASQVYTANPAPVVLSLAIAVCTSTCGASSPPANRPPNSATEVSKLAKPSYPDTRDAPSSVSVIGIASPTCTCAGAAMESVALAAVAVGKAPTAGVPPNKKTDTRTLDTRVVTAPPSLPPTPTPRAEN